MHSLPSDNERGGRSRRRRQRRMVMPGSTDERAAFLEALAQTTAPSFDFFLFSILAGLVLGVAILVDSQPLYILAALVCPFMAPIVGLSLAPVFASGRFFLRTLAGIFFSGLLVFLLGFFTGLIARPWQGMEFSQVTVHARFTWADALVLSAGVILSAVQLARNPKQKPLVASVALAYELYVPLGVAGFGLALHMPGLWPDGLVVFAVHLAWAALIGILIFGVLGLRPRRLFGITLSLCLLLLGVAAFFSITGFQPVIIEQVTVPTTSLTPIATQTLTPIASRTLTQPLISPSITLTSTPTKTLVPTYTPTVTISPAPTPFWAQVNASGDAGAVIRSEPGGLIVGTLLNGMLVEILPGYDEVIKDGTTWIFVRTTEGAEGWIVRALLVTQLPTPKP